MSKRLTLKQEYDTPPREISSVVEIVSLDNPPAIIFLLVNFLF